MVLIGSLWITCQGEPVDLITRCWMAWVDKIFFLWAQTSKFMLSFILKMYVIRLKRRFSLKICIFIYLQVKFMLSPTFFNGIQDPKIPGKSTHGMHFVKFLLRQRGNFELKTVHFYYFLASIICKDFYYF